MGVEAKTQQPEGVRVEVEPEDIDTSGFSLDQVFASDKDRLRSINSARYMYLAFKTGNYSYEKWDDFLRTPSGEFLKKPDPRLNGKTPLDLIDAEINLKLAEEEAKKVSKPQSGKAKKKSRPSSEVDWINHSNW